MEIGLIGRTWIVILDCKEIIFKKQKMNRPRFAKVDAQKSILIFKTLQLIWNNFILGFTYPINDLVYHLFNENVIDIEWSTLDYIFDYMHQIL